MELKDSLLLRDLDKTLAIAGVILSLILIVYLGREIGRVVYPLTGVLTLLSCLLWLAIRNCHILEVHLPESRIQTATCAICFFGLYTLSVLSVYLRPEIYERPLLYFILTAFMAGIIACEVFTSHRRHVSLILIQIMLLGVSIAWSQLLIFPSLLGIDPWFHSDLTNRIIDVGFISEGYVYSKLPLFHLMIASTSLLLDLPYKFATMVSVSLGQILCNALFIFLIANYLFKNHRLGLLAALMVIIANQHIFMSYWSIPNAFAAVFIPIAFYLFFFGFRVCSPLSSTVICIMVLATIILTHTITAMCMTILLFVIWSALAIYRAYKSRVDNCLSWVVPVGFMIAMFAWWTYASGSIRSLVNLIDWGFSIDVFVKIPAGFRSYATAIPLEEQLFNNLGMFLFFTFSFVGIFYMISRKGSSSTFAMAWVGMAPLAISFFSLISGHSVVEERWWYFAQILLSIPLAVAVSAVGTWKIKDLKLFYCFIFGFVAVLSFLMILSPPANVDNHMFSPVTGSTPAYTQSEMVASGFFATKTVGVLSSDGDYCTSSSSSVFIHIYAIDPVRLVNLDNSFISGEFDHDGSIKIVRSKCLLEPLMGIDGLSVHVRPDLNTYMSNLGFNRIYENPTVTGYTG